MRTERISIQGIPAVVCGEPSERVFLFVHGQNGSKEEAIDFTTHVCRKGWQVVGFDLPEHGERKHETGRFYPWIAVPELQSVWAFSGAIRLERYFAQSKQHWRMVLYARAA